MMMMKSRGLIADPRCSPTFTSKYSVSPSLVVTWVFMLVFNSIHLTVVFLTMYTDKLSCLIWRRAHSWQKVVVFFRNVRASPETGLSAVFQLESVVEVRQKNAHL